MQHHDMLAVYIHFPFCKSKCPYCDFNSHIKEDGVGDEWLFAYLLELDYFANRLGNRTVSSIFFGGGTPSLMRPAMVDGIINHIAKRWNIATDIEITLEANPTSVEISKFIEFRKAGVNRISVGVQSFNDDDLKFLGREHSSYEAKKALGLAGEIFENFSFDLIYARPEQTYESWENELKEAFSFNPNHISLYQLTIEKGSEFYASHRAGKFHMPSEEHAYNMYKITNDLTKKASMVHYEISNYAIDDYESRHNLTYWRYGEYIGIGAGAHSRIKAPYGRDAITMIYNPNNWIQQVSERGNGILNREKVIGKDIVTEILLMGLRLKEGININNFQNITGKKFSDTFSADKINQLIVYKLASYSDTHFRLTEKGRTVMDSALLCCLV